MLDAEGETTLIAAKQKRTWHVYVGNLSVGTSTNAGTKYLSDRDIEVTTCELADAGTGHWDERPSSFHVEIDYDKKDEVIKDFLGSRY